MALRDGMDFFLLMEEDAGAIRQDATGNGQAFLDVNTVTRMTGKFGYAAQFDSALSEYLYRPDGAKTSVSDGSFTIHCYVYPTDDSIIRGIWAKGTTVLMEANLQRLASDVLRFAVSADGSTGVWVDSADVLTVGAWNAILCRYDAAANEIGIRVNCGTWATETFAGAIYDGTAAFEIGRVPGGATYYWDGGIDSFAKWGRAISDAEADLLCGGSDYPWRSGFPCYGYLLQFGDYEFENLFYPAEDPRNWVVPIEKLPRVHGGRQQTATLDKKQMIVRGGQFADPQNLIGTGNVGLRSKRDALLAALAAGPANLYFDDDRYWRDAQCLGVSFPYGPNGWCRFSVGMEMVFEAGDPFQYELNAATDTWTAPGNGDTRQIVTGGNTQAAPIYRFTVGGSGTETIDWALENTTTGDSFTLAGDVLAGDIIIVDTIEHTVKIGTTNEIDLFDGMFAWLDAGSNTLSLTVTAGTVAQIETEYRNRWL